MEHLGKNSSSAALLGNNNSNHINHPDNIHEMRTHPNFTCYDLEELEKMIEFIFILSSSVQYGIIAIAVVGILMNCTAIQILWTRKSMKNTFNTLLMSLYGLDNIFLFTYIYLYLALSWESNASIITSRYIKLVYSAAFKGSIFMIVGITHERYIAVEHPIRHASLMSSGRARRNRFMKYFIPIIIFALLLIVPEWLEFELVWVYENQTFTPQDMFNNQMMSSADMHS